MKNKLERNKQLDRVKIVILQILETLRRKIKGVGLIITLDLKIQTLSDDIRWHHGRNKWPGNK